MANSPREIKKPYEALRFDEVAGGKLQEQMKVRSVICWADAYNAAFRDLGQDPPSIRVVLRIAINRLGLEDDLSGASVSYESCRQAWLKAQGVLKDDK